MSVAGRGGGAERAYALTMSKRRHVDDLRGVSRLAVEATHGVTAVVEEMHRTIAGGPAILGRPLEAPVRLATDLVYGSIREVTRLVGIGIERALEQLEPLLGESVPGPEREAVRAVLNGVLGDYLEATKNPLAIPMRLRHGPIADGKNAPRKLLVLVHGSSMSDRQWARAGHDHGQALAADLDFFPVYVQYNSGRHISTNGAELAARLEELVASAVVNEVVILGHSMGGLVARSACRAAELEGLAWRDKLRAMVFLGTPHHGAPLERGGNLIDLLLGFSRYSAPLARLGQIRSAGVTDLRFGNVLDEHWHGRGRFDWGRDTRGPLPLPEGVACYAIAGTSAAQRLSDGLVPVDSALGIHPDPRLSLTFPEAHKHLAAGVAHLDLLDNPRVYRVIRSWLE